MSGQVLVALEFACQCLKVGLVEGQRAFAAPVTETRIEPAGWQLPEGLWGKSFVVDDSLGTRYVSS